MAVLGAQEYNLWNMEEKKKIVEDIIKRQEALQDAIIQILFDFDFKKVHKVMDFLGWKWAMSGADENMEFRIPTEEELKEKAYKLLKDAVENESSVSCGGFEVILDKHNFLTYDYDGGNYHCNIGLKFVIEHSNDF